MRLIGLAERSLELTCAGAQRAALRFGRAIADQTVTQERIANARIAHRPGAPAGPACRVEDGHGGQQGREEGDRDDQGRRARSWRAR